MKISFNWLRTLIDLPNEIEEVEKILTAVGLEVEGVEDHRNAFRNIVVGEVMTCEKHPNADKLSVCSVSDGEETQIVVCGAPNVAAGQKVIFAKVGTRFEAAGFTIEKRALRGIESNGMICSTSELGLDENHDGIAVLSDSAVPGMPFAEHLGYDDVVFEIGITPNRGDALSHVGVARDLAAVLERKLVMPDPGSDWPEVADLLKETRHDFSIVIEDAELCPRYSAARISGIQLGESPAWIQKRLVSAGVRPINSIVDITNYVMLEIGQPMHAFDYSRIAAQNISVRPALEGEVFTTLDDIERKLPSGALMICDGRQPVAIAGVMGGQHSSIDETTTEILLESAHFKASSVRKTSKVLNLSTDSSYRFERGSDPGITVQALKRATQLILETAGGKLEGLYDNNPKPVELRRIELRPERVNAILGISIDPRKQASILTGLSIAVEEKESVFLCTIPSFRSDLEREIDLVEEVARIHGYDNIPIHTSIKMNAGGGFNDQAFTGKLRHAAIGLGFDEVISASLVAKDRAGIENPESVIDVLNPVSKERPSLRASLLTSLLEVIDVNVRNGVSTLNVFEVGTVYEKHIGDEKSEFLEWQSIAFASTGNASDREWYAGRRETDFFDLKGLIQAFFAKLGLDNEIRFSYDRSSTLSESLLTLEVKGSYAGRIMKLSSKVLDQFNISQDVFYAELEVERLRDAGKGIKPYRPVPKFPVVARDLAVVVNADISAEDLTKTIRNAGAGYLKDVRIIDVFSDESLGSGKKSLAATMSFQAPDKTLTDKMISSAVDKIIGNVKKRLNAELRG